MTSVKSILHNRLEGRRAERPPEAPPIAHANIRRAVRAPPARRPQFFH